MLLSGLAAAFFYMFAFVAVAASVMVVVARNPVHSVIYLILTFFNAAALFVLTGAEFLGMILLAVYVGAVAVLFLFVVMMLEIDHRAMRHGVLEYAPIGALVGIVIGLQLVIVLVGQAVTIAPPGAPSVPIPDPQVRGNTAALGDILYTDFVYFFQIAGLVLLVAMIGAIVLTLRDPRPHVKRQDVGRQVGRKADESVELVDVDSGKGI
ncbi:MULTISPECIES: NADH-quinone oxidoreductase subunit J [unclassified Roseitalea]|uniref:NADH-quinone oxidoreductase subunit J n=1 Tax=unclassified Roseitalea TaxID=2639107 RepID=UPI00273EDD90|nr:MULTISPECIES: NADH-quinone oxidoreductase subunit J [unclassified Roseitalea]